MALKRKVAAVTGDGRITLVEEDIPDLAPGYVLIEVRRSLVSPGTELGGWRRLKEQAANPGDTAEPRKFGYSNTGVIVEPGPGVEQFKAGMRVAAVGAGYAQHSDYAVVPQNLCIPMPDEVTFDQGVYAMLSATALHALRRGEPELGEFCAIIGLGIVGQLSSMLYQLAGNYVIGWDTIPRRLEIAREWGINEMALVGRENAEEKTREFTGGMGLDAAVMAFGGNGEKAYQSLQKCFKRSPDTHLMGRIVVVGAPEFTYSTATTNLDIRRASRTGPGYHDEEWERGRDYPPVFIRWDTRANITLCLRLMREGRLKVDTLTTHKIPLGDVESGIAKALEAPDDILGVVFKMRD